MKSDYDVASGATLTLPYPVITVNPATCFSVDSYVVVDSGTLLMPDYITLDRSSVNIFSDDRSLLGRHTLQITALISNGENLH